ncbi:hypothetical protein L218DRAFT_249810 [Marasmius fiardii PR-910]|nr:hypothetical protein L218DRAFT_249810 [Marasmius fiardii PR-910]
MWAWSVRRPTYIKGAFYFYYGHERSTPPNCSLFSPEDILQFAHSSPGGPSCPRSQDVFFPGPPHVRAGPSQNDGYVWRHGLLHGQVEGKARKHDVPV